MISKEEFQLDDMLRHCHSFLEHCRNSEEARCRDDLRAWFWDEWAPRLLEEIQELKPQNAAEFITRWGKSLEENK